jgi:hypothetical protein
VLATEIPLNVQSFSMQLSGTGQMTAGLNLQGPALASITQSWYGGPAALMQNPYVLNQPFIAGLASRRAVIWALFNDNGVSLPVWCGVAWDWPDMTRNDGGPLSVQAQTIDSVFSHRIISDTLEYPQVDLFTVFLDLVNYGQTKNSAFISSVSPPAVRPAAMLALMATNGPIANLVLPTGAAAVSGVPWTASYTWSDQTQISDAWSDMSQAGDFDYSFLPGLVSPSTLGVFLQLGYTQLGRPPAESGYDINYPGNALDYGYQVSGSQSANAIWATAPPNGSAEQWQSVFPFGWDLADLAAGYPVMETSVSWQGSTVTSQAQINAFAAGQLPLYSQGMTTPIITIGDGVRPYLTDIVLGDAFQFNATSSLHPPQGEGQQPGLQQQLRVTGWQATPSGPSQAASYQLQTTAYTG